jgi:pyruvate dehydrogenase E1 component beta subunit
MATLTLAKAINEGLRSAMERDPKVLVMGEDVGKLGGVFRVTDGLQKDFGEQRVLDTPLAESGIIGTAVGLAIRGFRPVCEIQFDGFVFPGYDQIVSQLAKLHFRSRGRCRCRSSCASRSAAASVRWSTTASRRRRCSRTSPGSRWWPAPTRSTPTG